MPWGTKGAREPGARWAIPQVLNGKVVWVSPPSCRSWVPLIKLSSVLFSSQGQELGSVFCVMCHLLQAPEELGFMPALTVGPPGSLPSYTPGKTKGRVSGSSWMTLFLFAFPVPQGSHKGSQKWAVASRISPDSVSLNTWNRARHFPLIGLNFFIYLMELTMTNLIERKDKSSLSWLAYPHGAAFLKNREHVLCRSTFNKWINKWI